MFFDGCTLRTDEDLRNATELRGFLKRRPTLSLLILIAFGYAIVKLTLLLY